MNAPLPTAAHATLTALHAHESDFVALRRDIHQHPELGYEEFEPAIWWPRACRTGATR